MPQGAAAVAGPLGRILDFDASTVLLADEEIPHAGAEVIRRYRRARWVDGSTHLWIGHCKRPGRGEGSSGLRFDRAEPT
jgi:hypothetical protein